MISTDPSLENVTIDGTPFNVLMQQAIVMKTEQLAVDRRKYDSWPSWLRNSLIVSDEIKEARKVPSFSQRLEIADAFENQAAMRYKFEDFDGAIIFHEKALGMWEWVETSVEDWRRSPIKDKDLTIRRFEPSSPSEKATMMLRQLIYLLGLAAAALESKQWARSIEACSGAIDIDPRCAKAYYRRGKARVLPLSAGTVDLQLALKDFETAVDIDPMETRFQQDYFALRSQLNKQKLKDKKTFGNFFERAKYLDEEEASFLQLQETQQKMKKKTFDAPINASEMDNKEHFSRDQLRHILKNIDEAIEKTEISLKHAQLKYDRLVLQRDQLSTHENEHDEEELQDTANNHKQNDPQKQVNEIELQLTLLEEELKELHASFNMWQDKKKSLHDVLCRAITEQQLREEAKEKEPTPQTVSKKGLPQEDDTIANVNNNSNDNHNFSSFSSQTSAIKGAKITLKNMDFTNPTQDMIDEAKAHGIDITDPTIQQLLLRRQKEHQQELEQAKKSTKTDHSRVDKKEKEAKLVQDAFHQEAVDIAEKILADSGEFSMRLMLFTRCTYGIEALVSENTDAMDQNLEYEWLKVYQNNISVKKMIDRVQEIVLSSMENVSEKKQNENSWLSGFIIWFQGIFLDCGPSKSIWEEENEILLIALALALEAQDLDVDRLMNKKEKKDGMALVIDAGHKRVNLFSHHDIKALLQNMLTDDFEHCYKTFQVSSQQFPQGIKSNNKQSSSACEEQQVLWSQCLEKTMNRYYHTVWEDNASYDNKNANNNNPHTFVLSNWPQTFLRYARFAVLYDLPQPHRQGNQCEHIFLTDTANQINIDSNNNINNNTNKGTSLLRKKEHPWWHQLHQQHIIVTAVILTWSIMVVYFLASNIGYAKEFQGSSSNNVKRSDEASSFSLNSPEVDEF